MGIKLVSLFLTLIYTVNVVAQTTSNAEALVRQYAEAYAQGDYTTAFQSLLQLYNETHSFESAISLAGFYIGGIGTEPNYKNAAMLYKSVADATQYDPNNESALLMIGFAARQYALMEYNINRHFSSETINYLHKADEVSDDALALYFLGVIFLGLEPELTPFNSVKPNIPKAISYLEKSAKRNCIAAKAELGFYYEKKGDRDKAFNYWMGAANTPLFEPSTNPSDFLSNLVNPNYSNEQIIIIRQNEAFYHLSKYYYEINDFSNALIWSEKITIEDPDYLDALAICYAADGQKQKSIDTFMHEYEISRDTDVLVKLAIYYYTHWHETDEAIRILEHVKGLGNTKAQNVIDMINSGEY